MLTNQELQSLRNLGNEAEAAADEIAKLRADVESLDRLEDWLADRSGPLLHIDEVREALYGPN